MPYIDNYDKWEAAANSFIIKAVKDGVIKIPSKGVVIKAWIELFDAERSPESAAKILIDRLRY